MTGSKPEPRTDKKAMNAQKAKVVKKQFKNLLFPLVIGAGVGVALQSLAAGAALGAVFSIIFTNNANRKHRSVLNKNKS